MAKVIWQGSNGAQGNDWNVGSNWSTSVVPQPGDDVFIPAGTPLVNLMGSTANVGSIAIDNGGSADLTGHLTVTGDFIDNGGATIDTSFLVEFGGSAMTISGTLTVTNSGAGFSIGNRAQTSPTKVTAGAVTNSGAINIAGDASPLALAELDIASAAGFGGVAGVLTGNINLGVGVGGGGGSGDALLDFVGGGLINTIKDGTVQLTGANAFIASGNATTSNSALTGPLTIAATGGLNLQGGPVITTQALTVAGNVSVDTGFLAPGGSKLTVTGVLTVTGNFSIGRSAMTIASTTVTAGGLANTGSINLNGDATGGFQGALNVGTAAGFGTAGVLTGNVQLTGLSLLDFASGQITTIDHTGTLLIDGTNTFLATGRATSSNSALAGLATMNGFFTMIDGAALTTGNDLSIANGVNFSNLNVDTVAPAAVCCISAARSASTVSAAYRSAMAGSRRRRP